MHTEIPRKMPSGYAMLLVLLLAQIGSIAALFYAINIESAWMVIVSLLAVVVVFVLWFGLFMVQPNKARVLQLFGKYVGTCKDPGLRWGNPLYSKTSVSLRVRNFESGQLKVNDSAGNPIEIAAVVVWRVVDTAEAVFEVDDYNQYVAIQSESALRNLSTQYPYDQHDEESATVALRSDPQVVADALQKEIQDRLGKAGVEVLEARISHLAYAPEIAGAMLRRQQADAIIAAREKVVEGAVGMVHMALEQLKEQGVVHLDEERKAAMVSNLLVVLCGDENPQPIINSGSLY